MAVVIKYESSWLWMRNSEWRSYVMKQLMPENSVFSSLTFSPPDEYDDWTMAAYKKKDSRKIEDLSLTDSL